MVTPQSPALPEGDGVSLTQVCPHLEPGPQYPNFCSVPAALSAPTTALQVVAQPPVAPGSQSERQTPAVAEVGAQIRFHSQESACVGLQAAPKSAWPLGVEQEPWKAPPGPKPIQEQTVPAAHVAAYGLHAGRQTGPLGPPSSMQSRPALHVRPGPQICPLPPVSVQVCAVVSQPWPFVQSAAAAHCTQFGARQTGVTLGQPALVVQPVCATQVLLLVHTCPVGHLASATHSTQAGNGLTRQTGVAAGQSCAWVAAVQTGLQAKLTHLLPAGHCPSLTHCTQEPVTVSQRGVAGREVQALSEVHRVETQVFCGEQVSEAAQSLGLVQATQVLFSVLHTGVGGRQWAQPEAARQVWSPWQVPPFGQSALARQATHRCGVAPARQRGVGAVQSESPRHCFGMQLFCGVQTSPGAHCVSSMQATQVPGFAPLPGLQ